MASDDDNFTLLADEAQSSFSAHRYVNAIARPKKAFLGGDSVVAGEDNEGRGAYGEDFAFDGAGPFAAQPYRSEAEKTDDDRKSRGPIHHQHHPDPKRKDRDELSDGESPHRLNNSSAKKSRPSSSSGDYRKDREEWSDSAIGCLLDAYTEKYVQLNRGNLRGRDWDEVAAVVSERRSEKKKPEKSVEQCKNKVDNLKKRYKVESQRLCNGVVPASHWPWFKKMELIVGSPSSAKVVTEDDRTPDIGGTAPPSVVRQVKRYPVTSPGSVSLTNNFKMKSLSPPRWKRVVLKISGATLAGPDPQNVDPKVIMLIAREIALANRVGVEVAVVVGGRNFFCGDTWVASTGVDRATTYQIGMMASTMNSVLLQASLEKAGVEARVHTGLMMQEIAEPYVRRRAIRHLEKGRVVIFGGVSVGTGNPLFTTDTAAALRASEINADALLKGIDADGMYNCLSGNVAFEHISFRDLVSKGFTAMDMAAITFCEENNISVVHFNLLEPGNISRALCGDQVGTLVDLSGRIS